MVQKIARQISNHTSPPLEWRKLCMQFLPSLRPDSGHWASRWDACYEDDWSGVQERWLLWWLLLLFLFLLLLRL